MEAKVPVQYIEVRCCGKTAPCPTCGRRGRRKQILPSRLVRTIAYKQVVYLRITAAECYAGCRRCKTFRSHPDKVGPRCLYDNQVPNPWQPALEQAGMLVKPAFEENPLFAPDNTFRHGGHHFACQPGAGDHRDGGPLEAGPGRRQDYGQHGHQHADHRRFHQGEPGGST